MKPINKYLIIFLSIYIPKQLAIPIPFFYFYIFIFCIFH